MQFVNDIYIPVKDIYISRQNYLEARKRQSPVFLQYTGAQVC